MYLSDLTFIEEGNSNTLSPDASLGMEEEIVNFGKRRMVSMVIRELQQYQHTPYALQVVPAIQDFLECIETLAAEESYRLSIKHEPRT